MRGMSRKECRRGEMVRCYSLVFGRGRESRVRVIGRIVEEGEGRGVVGWGR